MRVLPVHNTRLSRSPGYGVRAARVQDGLTRLEIRYDREATADGGTLLHRRTIWRRHLSPGFYFGWLQQTVLERSQDRLLQLLRERLDPPPPQGPIASAIDPGRWQAPLSRGELSARSLNSR
jgi:hypothetical protein